MTMNRDNPVMRAALDALVVKTRVIQYGQQKAERTRAILTEDEQRVADAQVAQQEIVTALEVLGIPKSESSALISQTINEWHAEQNEIADRRRRRQEEYDARRRAEEEGRHAGNCK